MTVVRPGIIIGPGDDTDRFPYWPMRVARGGEMIAPGDGSDHVQLIDVRDLAEFNIRLVEDRIFGVFNALGPQMGQPFKELLAAVQRGVGGTAKLVWIDTEFLRISKLGFPGFSIFQEIKGLPPGTRVLTSRRSSRPVSRSAHRDHSQRSSILRTQT